MNNNVKSNLWLCKSAIPFFKENSKSSIIIVSSIAGLQGVKNLGAYSVSKTADLGLIRSLLDRKYKSVGRSGEYEIFHKINK